MIDGYNLLTVRGYTIILLAVAFLFLFGYVITHRGKGVLAMLVVLGLLGGTGYFEWRWQTNEHKVDTAVQGVFKRQNLAVHCERLSESLVATAGSGDRYNSDNPGMAWLDNGTCNNLFAWMGSDKQNPTVAQATALYNLTAAMVGGGTSCAPFMYMTQIAEALGGSQAQGQGLADSYYRQVWSTTAGNPSCTVY